MKSVKLKKILPIAICLMAFVSMTSCNRGVGCPSDFSLTKNVVEKAVEAATIVAKKTIKKEILK